MVRLAFHSIGIMLAAKIVVEIEPATIGMFASIAGLLPGPSTTDTTDARPHSQARSSGEVTNLAQRVNG